MQPLLATSLPLPNKRQGKVRDVYDCVTASGEHAVLLVATDRLSAFDVVMPNAPAGKGIVLTQMAAFWFNLVKQQAGGLVDTHLISTNPDDIAGLSQADRDLLRGRIMIGRRAKVVPIECIARGYITGSGWKDYQKNGEVSGVKLPAGLRQCDKLPAPIFTPTTKAAEGHDEPISFDGACKEVGTDLMTRVRDLTLSLYKFGHDYAATRGIILADTKFEFGIAEGTGRLTLIDEVLTPDSSRYWPADKYAPGRDQESYDKQFVRNWLEAEVAAGRWNKQYPGLHLPQAVMDATMAKYQEACERLTGAKAAF